MRSNLLALFAGCVVAVYVTAQSFTPTDVAWMGGNATGEVVAPAGDGCGSDDLTFSWHCESTNVTVGSPVGCSVGDEIGAISAATISASYAYDGTYSLGCQDYSSYIDFDIDGSDLASDASGTVTFYLLCHEFYNGVDLLNIYYDANNYVYVTLFGSDTETGREIKIGYKENGNAEITANTTAANMALDTWYLVTAKWRQGASDPSLYIQVDATAAGTSNTDLPDMAGAPITLRVGKDYYTTDVFIDCVKVYSAWK